MKSDGDVVDYYESDVDNSDGRLLRTLMSTTMRIGWFRLATSASATVSTTIPTDKLSGYICQCIA